MEKYYYFRGKIINSIKILKLAFLQFGGVMEEKNFHYFTENEATTNRTNLDLRLLLDSLTVVLSLCNSLKIKIKHKSVFQIKLSL